MKLFFVTYRYTALVLFLFKFNSPGGSTGHKRTVSNRPTCTRPNIVVHDSITV